MEQATIASQVEGLSHPDPQIRVEAARALARTGDPEWLAPILERLPRESEPRAMTALLIAVGLLGSPHHLGAIAAYIDHEEPRVRRGVIEALFRLNASSALALIVPFLRDRDPDVRMKASSILNRIEADRVLTVLDKMVGSAHEWMRLSALHALTLLDRELALPVLEKLCRDPDPRIRRRAQGAVDRTATAPAGAAPGPAPTPAPERESRGGGRGRDAPPGGERRVAARSDRHAVGPPDGSRATLEAAIERRDRDALSQLVEGLEATGDRFLKSRVMSAIGILGETSLGPVLHQYLEDDDPRVVANAIRSLLLIGDREAVERIRPHLDSSNTRLRAHAIVYLSDAPGVDVRPALQGLLRSPDRSAHMAAVLAIAEMERPDLMADLSWLAGSPYLDLLQEILHRRLEGAAPSLPHAKDVLCRLEELRHDSGHNGPAEPAASGPGGGGRIDSGRLGLHLATPPGDPGPRPGPRTTGLLPVAPPEPGTDPLEPMSEKIKISARRWQSIVVASRVTATLTDLGAVLLPLVLVLVLVQRGSGRVPFPVAAALAGLGLAFFLIRDLPGGPGLGKKVMGLTLEVEPGVSRLPPSRLAPLVRQLPVLLAPWGLVELWLAGRHFLGQRWIDRRLGIKVVARGYPRLDLLAWIWVAFLGLVLIAWSLAGAPATRPDEDLWADAPTGRPGSPRRDLRIGAAG